MGRNQEFCFILLRKLQLWERWKRLLSLVEEVESSVSHLRYSPLLLVFKILDPENSRASRPLAELAERAMCGDLGDLGGSLGGTPLPHVSQSFRKCFEEITLS